jgi:uncharacterized protein
MAIARRDFLRLSAVTAAGLAFGATPATVTTVNDMPYRILGKTGEQVSLLCLGGAHIGRDNLTESESIALMRTAIDEGVNFFDNAWLYSSGRSEERMGKALKDGYRDKVFLMTKHLGRDRQTAQEHLETSLRRLDVDVIDLWQCHEMLEEDDPQKIYENGVIEFMLEAKEQGKIRYIGFTGHKRPSVHQEMITRGFAWDTLQLPLNVFDPHFSSFEEAVLPMAAERNIGVIAMKTLGGSPRAILSTESVSAAECLRYAMNLPVATVCSGMDTMEFLKHNIGVAKSFQPMGGDEIAALLTRTAPHAGDGQYEYYKFRA